MEDVPKKLNGLFKRGNKWSWRKRVPLELVDAYGRAEVVISTGTSDLKDATKKANLEAVKLDGEFDHLRRELKRRNTTGIKKRLFADLSESERVGIVLEWMKKCDAEFKENVRNVAPENVDDVAETFMEEQAGYADEHKRQAYQHSLRAAEQILDERNIDYTSHTKELIEFYDLVCRAEYELYQRGIQRLYRNDVVGTNTAPFNLMDSPGAMPALYHPAQGSGITLKQAVTDYVAEFKRTWAPSTLAAKERQFLFLFEILDESLDVAHLDARKAAEVRKTLLETPRSRDKNPATRNLSIQKARHVAGVEKMASRTINNYLSAYSGLYGWLKKRQFVQINPFEESYVDEPDEKKRDPFTKEQIKAILTALPQYRDDTSKPHRYWGTLIAMYSGARVNEVCQLALKDIKQSEDGIWCFDITETSDGDDDMGIQVLKNQQSKRMTPVHRALIQAGLLEYIDNLKARGEKRLFPELVFKESEGGYGRKLSRWTNDVLLVKLGIKTRRLTFHSYRHTLIKTLLNLQIPESQVKDIVGHKQVGTTLTDYFTIYEPHVLKEALDKLTYETGK